METVIKHALIELRKIIGTICFLVAINFSVGGCNGSSLVPQVLDASLNDSVHVVDMDNDGYDSNIDCDDSDESINPGAIEMWYDGVDQDCDGRSDYDIDGDGFDSHLAIGGRDCDDSNPTVYECGSTRLLAARTCASLHAAEPAFYDGVYWLDPDGDGDTINAWRAWCDMRTEGGGWTVVEKSPYGDPIGVALFRDVSVGEADSIRYRAPRTHMEAVQMTAVDLRVDCRGNDYLLTDSGNLFNGESGPDSCQNYTKVFYKEASFKGHRLTETMICTWNIGSTEGCAGVWHIDEHAQNGYCEMPNYPWTGTPVTPMAADTFATDPQTRDSESECHQIGAVRFVMLR